MKTFGREMTKVSEKIPLVDPAKAKGDFLSLNFEKDKDHSSGSFKSKFITLWFIRIDVLSYKSGMQKLKGATIV